MKKYIFKKGKSSSVWVEYFPDNEDEFVNHVTPYEVSEGLLNALVVFKEAKEYLW